MLQTQDSERSVLSACTEFLLDEADRLDARRLAEWTDLFAEDAVYWLPMDPNQVSPGDGLNLIYDDRPRLLDRVSRLTSGLAFSEEPHSATSHTLSPPRLLPGGQAQPADEHALTARCVIGRARQGRVDTFHAQMRWVLRDTGDSLRIVMKRIDLLNAADPLPVLTFLL